MTEARRRRQRGEILAIGRSGDLSRAVALARDHLLEFPDEVEVSRAVLGWTVESEDRALRREAEELIRWSARRVPDAR